MKQLLNQRNVHRESELTWFAFSRFAMMASTSAFLEHRERQSRAGLQEQTSTEQKTFTKPVLVHCLRTLRLTVHVWGEFSTIIVAKNGNKKYEVLRVTCCFRRSIYFRFLFFTVSFKHRILFKLHFPDQIHFLPGGGLSSSRSVCIELTVNRMGSLKCNLLILV